jgi:hypothetical protein
VVDLGPEAPAHRPPQGRRGEPLIEAAAQLPAPDEVWWDNPKTVATLILQGRERRLHPRYAALASHYVFDPKFCMPARGQEKSDAEATVKAAQRVSVTYTPQSFLRSGKLIV